MLTKLTKKQRVDTIIGQAISTRENGLPIDYAALERTHADLMPLLAEELAKLRRIQYAVQTARWQTPSNSLLDLEQPALDDAIHLLQEELDGYEVLSRIEYGGQGVVFKAMQRETKRPVALKVLLDGPLASRRQCERFALEVELNGRLDHPNIVSIYESGLVRGRPFFAMQYIEGVSVDQYVRSERTSVRDIVRIIRDVCLAVSAAHQRGIIHRDLKPANILVDRAGAPHVLDFGLAKDLTADNDRSRMSSSGQVVGTLPYLSPEQLDNQGEIDVRSDIYTIGVVLFELISGRSPYPGIDDSRLIKEQILNLKPIGLRKVLRQPVPNADDIEKIVAKTLEKDRSVRYQSADALADDLQRYLDGDAVAAKGQNSLYLLKKAVRKFRVPIAITTLFIAVLFTALIVTTAALRRAETLSELYESGLQAGAYVKMASVARDEGRVDQAIKMFEKAIQLSVFGEVADTRSSRDMRHVYNAKFRLAELLLDLGRAEDAQAHVSAAAEIADSMAQTSADKEKWELCRTFAKQLSGKSAFANHKFAQAREAFSVAAEAFGDFSRKSPDNLKLRFDHGYALALLAKCNRKLSQPDEAHKCLVGAKSILQDVVALEPQNAVYQIELARIQSHLGLWHSEQLDYDKANEVFHVAKRRLTKLQKSDQAYSMAREIDALLDYINDVLDRLATRANAKSFPEDR